MPFTLFQFLFLKKEICAEPAADKGYAPYGATEDKRAVDRLRDTLRFRLSAK